MDSIMISVWEGSVDEVSQMKRGRGAMKRQPCSASEPASLTFEKMEDGSVKVIRPPSCGYLQKLQRVCVTCSG